MALIISDGSSCFREAVVFSPPILEFNSKSKLLFPRPCGDLLIVGDFYESCWRKVELLGLAFKVLDIIDCCFIASKV